MIATTEPAPAQLEEPVGFDWPAHRLPFFWGTAYSLLASVQTALGDAATDTASEDLDRIRRHLGAAVEALRQVPEHPEGEHDRVHRKALEELEALMGVRGHPDRVDTIARESVGSAKPVEGPLCDSLFAVSYLAEWAVAGLREQLADR